MDLEDKVKELFFEAFPALGELEFDWNKKQKDYAQWDSFAQLNLITLAESKFNINLTIDESISITSAKDLLDCIKSHL